MNFKNFLKEESSKFGKLNHLEHVEDQIFHGQDGLNSAFESLKDVHNRLTGKPSKSKITIKYDGSPSIVFGHDAKGKFFVGTKSVFNKKPIVNYSLEDIKKNHPDKELANKLSQAFEHLQKVAPEKGIFQGDMMYTKDKIHEDNRHYHFTPNTIMYSVKKTDPEGQKIRRADFGIVVHTKYHGKDLDNLHANFDPGIHTFKNDKSVHIIDPELHLEKTNNSEELNNDVTKHMNDAETELNESHPDMLNDVAIHSTYLKRYVNQTVRSGEKPTAMGFKQFVNDLFNKEADKLKTPANKLKKKELLLSHLSHIDEHHDKYQSLLGIHHHLQQAKNALIGGLSETNPYESSINGDEISGEGYVVIHNGHPTKLVNREEFSKKNFEKYEKK